MQFILNRFNEKYPKQNALNIHFFNEDPLTVRRIRYNQGGAACYCMENHDTGKQKVSNAWKEVNCTEECQYRKSIDGISKPMCNLEGTLKFLLPEISLDRIWTLKITGYTSIQRLKSYINLQKQLGNSLIGDYTVFLKKEEQTNKQGKVFNNYILDIVKKEDFISNSSIQENSIISNHIQNNSNQIAENNISETEIPKSDDSDNTDKNQNITKKPTNKRETKEKKKEINNTKSKSDQKNSDSKNEFDNHYTLLDTSTTNLMKDGKSTQYVVADFVNIEDKTISVIIPPNFSEELLQCDMGTEVILELSTAGEKTFTKNIEYVQKCLKNVVA